MARKVEKFEFDGETYTVTQLPTSIGIPLGHRLVKAFGPTVREFVKSMPKGGLVEFARDLFSGKVSDDKLETLGILLLEALENCPTQLISDMGVVFADATVVRAGLLEFAKGSVPHEVKLSAGTTYDDHFAGRPLLWMKWVIACARFNYSGFFSSSNSSPAAEAAAKGETTPTA